MSSDAPADHRNQPVYWFAVLDIAKERGDFERAAEAQRELRRLGVDVRFRRPSPEEARP